MKRLGFLVFGMSALLGGCSGGSDFEPLPNGVCARQHRETTSDGIEVTVCDALHSEAPLVRLPQAADGHVFASVESRAFVTADGATYGGVDAEAEMTRHGVALYDLALEDGSVADYQPTLIFAESIFIAPFMDRSFDGLISRRVGEQEFADEASLPVRVNIDTETVAPSAGGGKFEARATIANAESAVTASDGSCAPSLASYGEESPFAAGAQLDIRVYRMPSMHDFGDNHFVISLSADDVPMGGLMSPTWYRGPIDVVRDTLAPSDRYMGTGHGSPGSIPALELVVATSGGDPCEP